MKLQIYLLQSVYLLIFEHIKQIICSGHHKQSIIAFNKLSYVSVLISDEHIADLKYN